MERYVRVNKCGLSGRGLGPSYVTSLERDEGQDVCVQRPLTNKR